MNKLPPQINDYLKKNYTKIEMGLFFFIVFGLILKFSGITTGNIILSISITTISMLYYLGAFIHSDFEDNISRIMIKVLHMSWAVFIVGFLFQILQLPQADVMINVGYASMAISFIILMFKNLESWNKIMTLSLARTVIMLAAFMYWNL